MATTSQIRQLQTPDNLVDVYPLTLEDAVFDGNGVQLSTKIHDLENRPLWNPKGTCTFANLPALSTAQVGDMWNISDQFTTTSDFREGAGILVPAGSNVYKTSDGKWDILTGSAVVGVKGNAEQNYRAGNVNITLQNLGYDVENDLLATAPGYVLDARQGRVISGSVLSISGRVDDIEDNISITETSSTATHAYAKGDCLTYNGIFYKVLAPIAIGDTLIPGTNIEQTTIAAELGGGGSVCFLGTCNTGATTATKTVTVSDPNYTLKTGTEIVVQFTYTNTAQNPTISVNGGAAKSIYYGSQVVTTEKLDIAAGTAGEYVRYVYDGVYWVWIGHGKDIDAGHTILDSSGAALAQEESLQFSGMNVSDDSTNKKTIVHGQLVKVTQAQYEALSAAQKNDLNTTWMITDTEASDGVSESITVTASNWSSSTTTVGGVAYYTNQISLSSVFDSHPDIFLGATGTFPTAAEKQAYMTVDYITVDSATNKLKCYARSKPTANFVIVVKGVTV